MIFLVIELLISDDGAHDSAHDWTYDFLWRVPMSLLEKEPMILW